MPEHSERPAAGASQSAAGAMWGLPDSARGALSETGLRWEGQCLRCAQVPKPAVCFYR